MPSILVIDDTSIIRYKLKNILTAEGFDVYEAAEARAVRENSFSREVSLADIDLILLDIHLKDENGLNLLQQIKKKHPGIGVMIVSVESKKEIVRQAFNLGAQDYLVKPFDRGDLIIRVNRLLAGVQGRTTHKVVSNKFQQEEEVDELKTSLSMEINRSIRSGEPLSLVGFSFSREVGTDKINEVKEIITGSIRNIDQVYLLSEKLYVFLLPLTDKSGSETFREKLISKLEIQVPLRRKEINTQKITFPAEIAEEDVDPLKQHQYREEMLNIIE